MKRRIIFNIDDDISDEILSQIISLGLPETGLNIYNKKIGCLKKHNRKSNIFDIFKI